MSKITVKSLAPLAPFSPKVQDRVVAAGRAIRAAGYAVAKGRVFAAFCKSLAGTEGLRSAYVSTIVDAFLATNPDEGNLPAKAFDSAISELLERTLEEAPCTLSALRKVPSEEQTVEQKGLWSLYNSCTGAIREARKAATPEPATPVLTLTRPQIEALLAGTTIKTEMGKREIEISLAAE